MFNSAGRLTGGADLRLTLLAAPGTGFLAWVFCIARFMLFTISPAIFSKLLVTDDNKRASNSTRSVLVIYEL